MGFKDKLLDSLHGMQQSSGAGIVKAKYAEIKDRGDEYKIKLLRRNAFYGWSVALIISSLMIKSHGWSWWWLVALIPSAYYTFKNGRRVIRQIIDFITKKDKDIEK